MGPINVGRSENQHGYELASCGCLSRDVSDGCHSNTCSRFSHYFVTKDGRIRMEENECLAQGFITKDSGKREEFSTGMTRDTQDDKPRYDLIDRAFLKRWAELMARGAKKYGEENWRKAATVEELTRFRSSAIRHMFQYLEGDRSEDHAAAICFNVAGAEMVEEKLKKGIGE